MNLDAMIATLQEGEPLNESDITQLMIKTMEVLYLEPNVLELSSPVTLCGDIHGQLFDLIELFERSGGIGSGRYLFMGDYVDRGYFSLETFCFLAALKLRYPGQIYLLRGNHECRAVNFQYGLYSECQSRHGHTGIWLLLNDAFDLLPMASLVDGRVFSIHGGLSPDTPTIEKISTFTRQEELAVSGPCSDLCWSDPDPEIESWRMNPRGAGYVFGIRQIDAFCRLNGNLELITRSHQLVQEGIQWCGKHLATVWSAPNYMYMSGNKATVMKYKGSGDHEIIEICPRDQTKRKKPEDLPISSYFL